MNLNATLLGQAISFVIFVWLCMKYVWPPLLTLLDERRDEIAKSLSLSANAEKELQIAKANGQQLIDEAKHNASQLVEQGNQRKAQIIAEAQAVAELEKERIVAQGLGDIELERNRMKNDLKDEMASLVIECAQKLIDKNLDTSTNREFVDKLIREI
ncbi:F0F1 ATP synthase subunit B [Photobacterium rosenbergii]|uniref:F0F1 ATP synthase subunit B n=1 Tax=Photobacterium rosenbergii TaxID=294936 RepID=UPI001C99BE82|nr:F0F1 ATP synthase subunit B [Photobacterium rosenbergii]MBY5947793.1 F0F1 ATP synthase subunit B [Photobacterium rosenbergii]